MLNVLTIVRTSVRFQFFSYAWFKYEPPLRHLDSTQDFA